MRYDVVVIGSGFGGSVAALRLVEKGYSVAGARGRPPVRRRRVPAHVLAGAHVPVGAAARLLRHPAAHPAARRDVAACSCSPAPASAAARWSTPTRSTSRSPTSTTTRSGATSPTGAPSSRRTTTRRSGCSASRTYPVDTPPTARCARWPSGWASATPSTRRRSASTSDGRARPSPTRTSAAPGPTAPAASHCGACMTGCRHGAKNTLVKNYLWLAERAGVEVHPLTTVTAVRPAGGGLPGRDRAHRRVAAPAPAR